MWSCALTILTVAVCEVIATQDVDLISHKILTQAEVTLNDKTPCRTRCHDNTCQTVLGATRCLAEEYIYYTIQPTKSGGNCATPCLKEIKSPKNMCYNSAAVWTECTPFPDKRSIVTAATKNVNIYGTYTERGYIVCTKCSGPGGIYIVNRSSKRQTDFRTPLLHRSRRMLDFNFLNAQNININDLASRYEIDFPEHVIRILDPFNIVNHTQNNPILSYRMIPLPGTWAETQVFLPLAVWSLITNYTRPDSVRRNKKVRVETNYQNMDPMRRDERCHIVAHRFNGPNEVYNIFPGTWDMNRGRDSEWNRLENDIADFVNQHANGYVEHTVVLSYNFNDPDHPTRPNAVGMRLRFYNNQHVLSDSHGVPLARPNPYENMYFNNDPDYCCSAELIGD